MAEGASAGLVDVVGRAVGGGGSWSPLGLTSLRAAEALQEDRNPKATVQKVSALPDGFT